ncbi:MAG: S-layer protein [Theionarchaea archaeon]|nr:S-layer protein [Theionarchaea archaeon]MBU7037435.1 S-layer protein [Theionarchaea archaeon]
MNKLHGVLAGGMVLMSFLLSSANSLEIPAEFFVDEETGTTAVTLVVGKDAAAMDVISATVLAAAIGTMTFTESDDLIIIGAYSASHDDIRLLGGEKGGLPTVDVPDSASYAEWDNTTPPLTYSLRGLWYFDDDNHAFWGNGDSTFQPWETHEEFQLQFNVERSSASSDCRACLYGWEKDIRDQEPSERSLIPGITYRADNIFVPPSVLMDLPKGESPGFPFAVDFDPYTLLFVPEPWMVIHEHLPCFTLFGEVYTVIDAGPVLDINFTTGDVGYLHGMPYVITGTPHFEEVLLKKGDLYDVSDYSIELLDVDIDNNKAYFEASVFGEVLEDFWMTLDPLTGFSSGVYEEEFPFTAYPCCNDLNRNRRLDPRELTALASYDYDSDGSPDYDKAIIHRIEEGAWADYTWFYYADDQGQGHLLFSAADIVIDGVQIVIGKGGTLAVRANVYWLENKKFWYGRSCASPWTSDPHDYRLVLDVYQTGWDDREDGVLLHQPPGTGLWPPDTSVAPDDTGGNGLLDSNDGHIGYEAGYWNGILLEGDDLDRDGSITNDCKATDGSHVECINTYDIEDPAVWHAAGQLMVELNVVLCENLCPRGTHSWDISGPSFEDKSYFSIEVTDVAFDCEDGDGISYLTAFVAPVDYSRLRPTNVDETTLVQYDTELDFGQWKSSCGQNLILIGGPVANIIVRELVTEGISRVDWELSDGEWEYIKAPYGTCDMLIVAGKDRDATRAAAKALAEGLR